MGKTEVLIITKSTTEDIKSANEFKVILNKLLEDRGYTSPNCKVITAPKYSSQITASASKQQTPIRDFDIRRSQLFDAVRIEDPHVAIFLASSRDKLMEQACSVLSYVENFECIFFYFYFGANPNIKIKPLKGVSLHYDANDKMNAMAIGDLLARIGVIKRVPRKTVDDIAQSTD